LGRFLFNDGGYSTLSFIPTLATMVLGLIVGELLRSPRPAMEKVRWLVVGGAVGLATGTSLGWLGICPVVKRIWTPSWTLYSGGWCCLLMAAFYLVIDVWGKKAWAFPLVVVGMNSIAAYCSDDLFDDFFSKNLTTHLGPNFVGFLGAAYEPLLHGAATLLVAWLILFWMYRRKIFLRI
jgi:predicted acyltransferase